MSDIADRLNIISDKIKQAADTCGRNPSEVQLIAVSKRKSVAAIQAAIKAGAGHFGENYIQEACAKIDEIGKDAACWHFIGHLQSKKSKIAVEYFDYIHTVDTIKLAKEINKRAAAIDKIQNILIQINISAEESKSGTTPDAVLTLVKEAATLENISIQGLMGMPPYLSDPEAVRPYFKKLADIRDQIKKENIPNVEMNHLSMGMSGDFVVAIEEGSTMVRVGTAIFGRRD